MTKEEKIKDLAKKISKALLECDDFTYEDMACAISYLVGILNNLSEKVNNTSSISFAKYVYEMIGFVHKVSSDNHAWRPSTEHPFVDEEVIALVGKYNKISFAHIVDKERCVDYDGWNIPEVKCWIPCPKWIPCNKIEED